MFYIFIIVISTSVNVISECLPIHYSIIVLYLYFFLNKQANFENIVIPRPVYGFVTYLMKFAFTFTFASREFPPICLWRIACDSINNWPCL